MDKRKIIFLGKSSLVVYLPKKRIGEYASDIAELTIDRTYKM